MTFEERPSAVMNQHVGSEIHDGSGIATGIATGVKSVNFLKRVKCISPAQRVF